MLPSDSSTMGFQPTPHMLGATRGSRPAPPPPRCFNPRPSCKGRRVGSMRCNATHKFQPTPLMRGATLHLVYVADADVVSTHAPHARGDSFRPLMRGAPVGAHVVVHDVVVSTHAPHARGDACPTARPAGSVAFQPTPLMRGATQAAARFRGVDEGSTHAPHARRDCQGPAVGPVVPFHPTPLPRGATVGLPPDSSTMGFQPTPLMRGATLHLVYVADADVVSTHAPHARGDSFRRADKPVGLFQPTPLMRGATRPTGRCTGAGCFNPRPSCEGRHDPRHRLR